MPTPRKVRNLKAQIDPVLVMIPRAAEMIDSTERDVRDKLRAGLLVAVKDGRLTKVTVESIKALPDRLPRAEFTPLPSKEGTDV